MKIRSKKNKGTKLQKMFVDFLKEVFSFSDNELKSIPASVPGVDIWLSDSARELFPFAVECKNQERINLYKFWQQAKDNAEKEGLFPMLVVKSNRKEPLVVVDLNGLKYLLRQTSIGNRINDTRVILNEFRTNNPKRGGIGEEKKTNKKRI